MGGDGGQVIDRATMVKTRGWGFTKGAGDRYANSLGEMANYVQMVSEDRGLGPLERHRLRMSCCWLSQEPLRDPVVACRLGNLYNKEAVISALLSKSVPAEVGHIRALKDVKHCLLSWAEADGEEGRRRLVCPVSREDLDTGSSRAVLIWPSGAVISAKSLKELKMKECPVTAKAFDAEKDLVTLAPDKEELEAMRERLPAARKRKASAAAASSDAPAADAASTEAGSRPAAASTGGAEAPPAKATRGEREGRAAAVAAKSEVFKSMFTNSSGEGKTGTHDAFGTPVYNRGACIA
mmetsp:Transcript_86743/g.269924  ORF Transcript_86743/g.269924 Transcript_86743/m.269924 type:complete len:295 (-) Transcript_86743:83-967(-)